MSAIAIVAPEPVSWLDAVVAAAARLGPVTVLCPWRLPAVVTGMSRVMPAGLARFVARRSVPDGVPEGMINWVALPGWTVAEGLLRTWVRGRTDRDMRARFAVRRVVDILAERWLRAVDQRPRVILTPSLAARRTLAAASQLGVIGILLEDMPDMRGLHRDLDRALARHPDCGFLARYRAPGPLLARQEVERVLAHTVAVRGYHARAQRLADGLPAPAVPAPAVVDMPTQEVSPAALDSERTPTSAGTGPTRVLLAGLAAARHGTVEALAAVATRPDMQLVVRPGEGLEPPDLLAHAQVRPATAEELATLRGVHAVIAPALCETYPRVLALAQARGLPTVATRRAAGFCTPTRTVAPGDIDALRQALHEIVGGAHTTRSPTQPGEPDGARPLARHLAELLSSPTAMPTGLSDP